MFAEVTSDGHNPKYFNRICRLRLMLFSSQLTDSCLTVLTDCSYGVREIVTDINIQSTYELSDGLVFFSHQFSLSLIPELQLSMLRFQKFVSLRS